MKDWAIWFAVHTAHWALLYGAFFLHLGGALNVLMFLIWLLAVGVTLTLALPPPKKILPKSHPLKIWLSRVVAWATLGALVWSGCIFTALAWGYVMLVLAINRNELDQRRKANATAD